MPRARGSVARAATLAFAVAGVLAHGTALATPLESVVRAALADYPTIRAAQANRSVGMFRVEQEKARHLPVFDVNATGRVSGTAVSEPLPRARVNLWASGAIDAAVDREAQREASLALRETVTREDVAFAVTQAYLRVLRAYRLVKVSEANLARHERLVANFQEIVGIDPGRRFDLVQAQSRAQLVRATLEDRQAELQTAREALARFTFETLVADSLTLPDARALPPDAIEAVATEDHPAVAAARRDLLSAEANARATRLNRLPRLDFEATGGRDPLSQVVLIWPAFDARLSAVERGAAAEQIGAEATLQDTELAVLEARRQAAADFASASRRLDQARSQLALATELVTIYYDQFRVGRRSLLDLLTAYVELAAAESNIAGLQVDQVLARFRMAYAAGRLVPLFDGRVAALPLLPAPPPAVVPPFASGPR
jgi:adhesin transport system outer membrane protein